MGGSQNLGYPFGGPYNKDYSILGSELGFHYFGKLPHTNSSRYLATRNAVVAARQGVARKLVIGVSADREDLIMSIPWSKKEVQAYCAGKLLDPTISELWQSVRAEGFKKFMRSQRYVFRSYIESCICTCPGKVVIFTKRNLE